MSDLKINKIRFWSVVMLTVVSVASLRNLPSAALFGDVLIGYYLFAGCLFLLPAACVAAELAAHFEHEGGVFSWVSAALGPKWGVYAIWLQWISNVIWYPTILSFIVATLVYVFVPDLSKNTHFLAAAIVVVFTLMTVLNLRGIISSARFSEVCTWFGLILPMSFVIILGAFWVMTTSNIHVQISAYSLVPDLWNTHHVMSLSGIALSLCGIEVVTVHARDVDQPGQTYPRALLFSAVVIVMLLIFGSLSIAAVLPKDSMSLVAGVMQAFEVFLKQYHLELLLPAIAIMLVMGGLGAVNNWIIAPARGLLIAAQSQDLPKVLASENSKGAPVLILVGQGLIVSMLCLIFLYFPRINEAYWLLTVLASQLYMLMYFLLFISCCVLRRRRKTVHSTIRFQIPGGIWGCFLICLMGGLSVICIFLAGFMPPHEMQFGSITQYHLVLLGWLLVLSLPPFLLRYYR